METSYTYNQEITERFYQKLLEFLNDADALLKELAVFSITVDLRYLISSYTA